MPTIEKSTTPINQPTESGGAAARAVDQVTTSTHEAIDRASDTARPVVDRLAASAHRAVDRVAGGASGAAQSFDVRSGQLRGANAKFADDCRGRIRDRPLAALGLAIAAGAVLGWSLGKR